ncbi:MAG: YcgL domain-containing protein [Gammaproteobacteria bacterium]
MQCVIYKGRKKADTYLYLEREGDFSRVPPALLALLGPLEPVLTLELGPQRTLARADVDQVRAQLREQGYYLQMPPREGADDLQERLKTEGFYMRIPDRDGNGTS